jgi:hypothetical protein
MSDEKPQAKPPYLPWTTFQNVTDELRGKGLPETLDRTAIQGKSGSTQTHYLAALRYLGMSDAKDRPTERFKAYMANTEQRPTMMAEILKEKYGEALALGASSTPAQLTAQFREYGVEGETGRKAIAFFLNAARFANIKVSPYWPQTRPGGGGRRRQGNGAAKTRKRGRSKAHEETIPTTQPAATDAKSRYIDLLLKKAEEEFDTDLLDRIEKVIGVGDATSSKTQASVPAPGQDDGDIPGGDES